MKPTYKKLHELLELADRGVKFKARRIQGVEICNWKEEIYFAQVNTWSPYSIQADWEYIEHKEPEVVKFECEWFKDDGIVYPNIHISLASKLCGRTWKVVCTEVVDE